MSIFQKNKTTTIRCEIDIKQNQIIQLNRYRENRFKSHYHRLFQILKVDLFSP